MHPRHSFLFSSLASLAHLPQTPGPHIPPLPHSHPRSYTIASTPTSSPTPPVLPESTFAPFPHNSPSPPHSLHSQPQEILPPHDPPRGLPSLPPSFQTWLELISSPRVGLPIPNTRTRRRGHDAHLCPSLTAHGHMSGPPGPLHRHSPRPCGPQVTRNSGSPVLPGTPGLGARGLRAALGSPLGAPGPQRAGAGMGAGRRAAGSALRRGPGGGLEGRRQRPALKPCHPRCAGASGGAPRTADPGPPPPPSPGPSAAGRRRERP